MLTPEDITELKPKFEKIQSHLNLALGKGEADISEDACGHYIVALSLMEELVDETKQKQGHSVGEALKRVVDSAKSPEGVGVAGGLSAAAASLSLTGLGGFGLAAGGTAVGISGLAGAAVATGGAGLAGAAALYLAYKGGAATLESGLGQKIVEEATSAGKNTTEKTRAAGKKVAERLDKIRIVDQATSAGKNTTEKTRAFGRKTAERLKKMRNTRSKEYDPSEA